MTEELKQKAEDYAEHTKTKDKNTYVCFPYENISQVQDYEGNYIDISERIIKAYSDGATEATKELQAQIEKMQNCRNCKKEKIEGACGHFTQVGWCKNWELAD